MLLQQQLSQHNSYAAAAAGVRLSQCRRVMTNKRILRFQPKHSSVPADELHLEDVKRGGCTAGALLRTSTGAT